MGKQFIRSFHTKNLGGRTKQISSNQKGEISSSRLSEAAGITEKPILRILRSTFTRRGVFKYRQMGQ